MKSFEHYKKWAETDIGKIFVDYENAMHTAISRDEKLNYSDDDRGPSTIQLNRARESWEKADQAKKILILAISENFGIEHP